MGKSNEFWYGALKGLALNKKAGACGHRLLWNWIHWINLALWFGADCLLSALTLQQGSCHQKALDTVERAGGLPGGQTTGLFQKTVQPKNHFRFNSFFWEGGRVAPRATLLAREEDDEKVRLRRL
jgi:hypothetical protein